jgi:tRNA(fMet)-specific endonuclease VapC
MILVDTSFIIDILKNNATSLALLQKYDSSDSLAVSSLTVFELFQYAGDVSNEIIETLVVLDATKTICKKAGGLRRELQKKGKEISPADSIIAATALEHDILLITSDSHFKRIPNLNILHY